MAAALCGWGLWAIRGPEVIGSWRGGRRGGSGLRLEPVSSPQARGRTLVVYVFSGSDPEYADNLRFFIGEAVKVRAAAAAGRRLAALDVQLLCRCACSRCLQLIVPSTAPPAQEGDGCDYVIVLQQSEKLSMPAPLPVLPPNARYLRHANECFDIGTVGWVLHSQLGPRGTKTYKYFVWLNSSVRGPFLPAYLRGRLHWTEPLLSKLSSSVKLVSWMRCCLLCAE